MEQTEVEGMSKLTMKVMQPDARKKNELFGSNVSPNRMSWPLKCQLRNFWQQRRKFEKIPQ